MPLHESTFEYLKPTEDQITTMAKLRSAAASYAKALENLLRFLDDATDYELQHASDYGAYLDAKAALKPHIVGGPGQS